jgi:hypothetical protein
MGQARKWLLFVAHGDFQLVEENWLEQGRYGEIGTCKEGTSQKMVFVCCAW